MLFLALVLGAWRVNADCLATIDVDGTEICLENQDQIADLKLQLALNEEVTANSARSMVNEKRLRQLLGEDPEESESEESEDSEEEPVVNPACQVDRCAIQTPVEAFEAAEDKQMAMILKADVTGHRHYDIVDGMVFTTTTPKEAYAELVAQVEQTWNAEEGSVHFSYRVTQPAPAQVRIRDDGGLWAALVMASYMDIDVPVIYAEMGAEIVWDELHWWNFDASHFIPPTPQPTATPTLSGIEIDGVTYTVHYGKHDLAWDQNWKGSRIVIEDGGVTARMNTGNGHQSTRAETCFSEGQHMWRLQVYTNDDERQTNVEWMETGIITEGNYVDGHHINNRSCGLMTHSNANYCNNWGNIKTGAYKQTPDQTTLELLLDCDEGLLTWRFFEAEDSFITYNVPECNDSNNCLYPWLEMHYADKHNSGTILGEPVDTFYNEWDESDYELHFDLKWDEEWMGSRIRCENNCKIAHMHTGNGHQNTRTTEGFESGKHAWRIKLYADDGEKNTNAEWLVTGMVTEGDYFDGYNQADRSCGLLAHSVQNYCNSWGYIARGSNNRAIPSMQTLIMMLDVDEGLMYYQFQGEDEPWLALHVAKAPTKLYPWCQMHYGDSRQNRCHLLGQMFEFENVNHHFEQNGTNG